MSLPLPFPNFAQLYTNSYAAKVSVVVSKIILLLIVAVTTTRRGEVGGGYQERRTMSLTIFVAKTPSHAKYFLNILLCFLDTFFL